MATITLPPWAAMKEAEGLRVPQVDVDADAAYEAIYAEYQAHYSDPANVPDDWKKKDGEPKAEFARMLEALRGNDVYETTAYWLEVVYQSIKLDLATCGIPRPYVVAIHDRHPVENEDGEVDVEKHFRQADRDEGRGPELAAGPGAAGGTEAREHYKRLRGYLPT